MAAHTPRITPRRLTPRTLGWIAFLALGSVTPSASGIAAQDQVKVLSAFGASGPRRPPKPTQLRLQIITTNWAGGVNVASQHTDTITVLVKPGDDLDGHRDYGGRGFSRGAPFTLGTIVDAGNAWVRFTRDVVPDVGDKVSPDSILVSTVWRSFHTPSYDAGILFRIRILNPGEPIWNGQGMQVFPHLLRGGDHASRASPTVGRGRVWGTLRYPDAAPLPDAEISLADLVRSTTSSSSGAFEFDDVPIGHHVLRVRDGHGETKISIQVSDEKRESLDVVVSRAFSGKAVPPDRGTPPTMSAEGPVGRERIDVWPLQVGGDPPRYPYAARALGIEGDAHVLAWVDSLGVVRRTRNSYSASPLLDASALECVKQWRFRPALVDGRPLPCWTDVAVHFEHPRSPELIAQKSRVDSAVVSSSRAEGGIEVEVSARLDSLTGFYSYSYRMKNLGRKSLIAAFALMPVVGEIEDMGSPDGWNGFSGCGGRGDVIGCMAWSSDGSNLREQMIRPAETLGAFSFRSRNPPALIRWFAQAVNPDSALSFPWLCGSGDPGAMSNTPLQGITMGPQPPAKAAR